MRKSFEKIEFKNLHKSWPIHSGNHSSCAGHEAERDASPTIVMQSRVRNTASGMFLFSPLKAARVTVDGAEASADSKLTLTSPNTVASAIDKAIDGPPSNVVGVPTALIILDTKGC